jgi:hypothetical protein
VEGDRYAAADRSVAAALGVVIPCAVRVVTQKDADRSVEASLRYEVDRNVVTPNAVLVVTLSVVTPNGVRVLSAQSLVADRKSVARIGFQPVAARSHAADRLRFVADLAHVSLHPQVQPVAESAQDDHPIPAQAAPPLPTAPPA